MKLTPVTIINSKAAKTDLLKIKNQHSDVLKNMQLHKMKVDQFKLEQENKKQMENNRKMTEKATTNKTNIENKKMHMEIETKRLAEQNKAVELEIKRKALES